jgi:hypothetical protein
MDTWRVHILIDMPTIGFEKMLKLSSPRLEARAHISLHVRVRCSQMA